MTKCLFVSLKDGLIWCANDVGRTRRGGASERASVDVDADEWSVVALGFTDVPRDDDGDDGW